MEDYKDIIAALKQQKNIDPRQDITERIMERLERNDERSLYKSRLAILRISYENNTSERITSYSQCAILLFLVGSFYLIAGITTLWTLHDVLGSSQLNFWLKVQLFIPGGSGLLILTAAFYLMTRPQRAMMIQYLLVLHVLFVFVNAVILENVLSVPWAWIYVMILTMMSVLLGVLLIGAIRSAQKLQIV